MQPYERLEKEWAEWNQLDPAGMVCCSSGTSALHLACEALQLPLGSKVIVPDFNMIAVPRAVTLAELEPVFVDCGDDLNMDPSLIPVDPDCVMAVHIYGRRCDMEAIHNRIETYRTCVIEDLAEAHGVRPHPQTDAACWSFYKNKIVAGEEGGAVWFRDPKHAALARQLRSLGFTDAHDFDHVPRGHNYRMSNAHANIILEQYNDFYWNRNALDNYREILFERRQIEAWYDKHCPQEWRMPPRDAPWVYDLRIRGMTSNVQNRVVAGIQRCGIAARHAFKPMCDQQEYKHCKMVAGDNINGTRSRLASREVMYLPIVPGKTTEADCRRSFEIIKKSLES